MIPLSNAEIVVIGGGAVGCGVAHALAKAGKTDIVVLERAEDLGQATTSQGAGLCGQTRDSVERIRLAMHSVATFRELQRDREVTPDWHEVGSLRVALTNRRAAEFDALKRAADDAELETEIIDRQEAKRLWPLMDFSRATSILWCPSDGYMTPDRVVKAYAHQCRKLGVRFATGCLVEEITSSQGRVSGVRTSRGTIECRYVINAAGAHAYHVAKLAGIELPIIPVRHEYFITVPMPGLSPQLPCFRFPDLTLYGRVRDEGLLLGGWEPVSLHKDPRSYPMAESPGDIHPDWNVLDNFDGSFQEFMPASQGAKKVFVGKGWPTFTPDGRFIIGESRRRPGFIMAGGCNAHGISGSGGIGALVVQSLLDPKPSDYVKSLSPDRFTETSWSWETARTEAARVYETYYGV